MTSMPVTAVMPDTTETLRLPELANRLLKSCKRKPIDIMRWVRWRNNRGPLSIEMLQNAVKAGGKKVYARAILLQLLSEFSDDGSETVPALTECERLVIEADLAGDRERQMALLDGQIDEAERKKLEIVVSEEIHILDRFLDCLRNLRLPTPQRVGVRQW